MIKFKTETGSIYMIDLQKRTWERPYNPQSTHVRTTRGIFEWISQITIGERVKIIGPPLTENYEMRLIVTSPVVEIEEEYGLMG